MPTYIALLRGINIGGHNKLPMADLKKLLREFGLKRIRTYIQSGNVVFDSEETDKPGLAEKIRVAVNQKHHFAPQVMLLSREELSRAISANPYPEAEEAPKSVHLYFLSAKPENPDLEKLEKLKRSSEHFALQGRVFYLQAPEGIGRSKLAAAVEKALGVPVTARNWRTVRKLEEMVA
ncbi:MAG: DUF1697 domain-containing protein [Calditrichia bacterium]